jgi:uncharacterized RDD family membrane protein YckC
MPAPQDAAGDVLGALDVSIDLPLATPASRSLAYFIDELVIVLMGLSAALVGTLVSGPLLDLGLDTEVFFAVLFGGWFLLDWSWFTIWEAATGRTPGKRWMGIRVVRTDGRRVGLLGAMIRNLLRSIDTLPGGFVALVTGTLTPRFQRLGDLAAGTMVIRDAPAAAPRARPTTWPAGIADADVAIVEAFFDRAAVMTPEARGTLSARLAAHVAARHPGFLDGETVDPESALTRAFGVSEA